MRTNRSDDAGISEDIEVSSGCSVDRRAHAASKKATTAPMHDISPQRAALTVAAKKIPKEAHAAKPRRPLSSLPISITTPAIAIVLVPVMLPGAMFDGMTPYLAMCAPLAVVGGLAK